MRLFNPEKCPLFSWRHHVWLFVLAWLWVYLVHGRMQPEEPANPLKQAECGDDEGLALDTMEPPREPVPESWHFWTLCYLN